MVYDALIAPFTEFEFMRRALAGTIALALGAGPIGVFLMLRRMSLVGDAMAHAILPGAAVGFLVSGLSLWRKRAADARHERQTTGEDGGVCLAAYSHPSGAIMYDALIAPFAEFEFMRRALAGTIALALGAGPIGVFLMLRRMSLVGDAMAHAILPGAAVGFLLSGLSLFAMTAGGLIAGCVVALLTGLVSRMTELKEDAALATFYLLSLALGVTIVSVKGTNIDLLHVLFGSVLALDDQTLLLIAFNATITLIVLALIYRPLVVECVDPGFLRSVSRAGAPAHLAFLALVVVNLVSGFHALGTLLAVGIMMLPAATGRFWARDVTLMIAIAAGCGAFSGYAGLLLSFHTGVPAGPAIILVAGVLYVLSLLFGHVGGLVRQVMPRRHLEA